MAATNTNSSSSSSSRWHNFSTRISTCLASALLEWLLILFLFTTAVFSYVITKFASYCKLKSPCVFCSRIDHVLGKEKNGYYLDLICSFHKSEISSLVYCSKHDKLVNNIQGVSETSIDKSHESGSVFHHSCCCSDKDFVLTELRTRGRVVDFDRVDEFEIQNSLYEKIRENSVKISSDTESEYEVALSDDAGVSVPVHGRDDTEEGVRVCTVDDLNEDLSSGKLGSSASDFEPLLSEPGMQVENTVTRGTKIGVSVEESKENYDFKTSKREPTVDSEENISSGNKLIASEAGLESTLVCSDIGQQNLTLLDLGDAYKLAVGNRGRQLSGMLAEHWLGKDSSRVNEDLKILMSQFSVTRGTDMSFNDISPRLSINSEEAKSSDVSNSTGMQILQKMISLERNESGLSLDGSIVGEIEGESPVDKLKRQVDHDRKLMSALYKELEEERNASAIAASQALAMITRLQEEKAALHMEALQHLRMMDEQSEYEMEALQNANDLLAEKEKEIEELEAKVEFYRTNFPNEMLLENTVEKNSEMKVKDIGLDHSQYTFVENNESVPGKSVDENPNIYDKNDILLTSAEEKKIQSVKSSIMEFQDEKLYISQHLNKLEKQVYFFLNTHHSQDNFPYSENVGNQYPENSEKLDNNLLTEDSLSSFKLNSDATIDDPSSKNPPVCKQNGETKHSGGSSPVLCGNNDLASTRSVVSDIIERLQALEADHSFLEHTINLLSEEGEGIKLLQEIANRLQQLRMIGIRERDHPVA